MTSKQIIERDAQGQYAPSQADAKSDGVVNAIATNVADEDDATLYNLEKKPSPSPGFEILTQTNERD
ncbi:MAG: hypothetical protein EOP83_31655 [Verrucomicrobiaceae bacterium]|nr:MAG: hypothetical protein EOP83_31655 [Verrucomicrobiaceae bacterium]